MYKYLAKKTTEKFISLGTIETDKKVVYEYGFEVLFSTIVYTAIFLLMAVLTDAFLSSVLFWIGFFIVRSISGGFHAKSYIMCHLLFMLSHIVFIATYHLCPTQWMNTVAATLCIISLLLILCCAPIDHPNKPFTDNERARFKKLSQIYCIVLFVISVAIVLLLQKFNAMVLGFSFGTFIAAFALFIAKIKNHIQNKTKEKTS